MTSPSIAIRELTTDSEKRRLFHLAEQHIPGFSAHRARREEEHERRRVTSYLPRAADGTLIRAHFLGAFDNAELVGGSIVHPSYLYALEHRDRGESDQFIRDLLRTRYTLSGLVVLPAYRRSGIATEMVHAQLEHARAEGAFWVAGFMDEHNGTPAFYRALGFTVGDRNQPLPPLPPAAFRESHPRYLNGWWFHRALREGTSR